MQGIENLASVKKDIGWPMCSRRQTFLIPKVHSRWSLMITVAPKNLDFLSRKSSAIARKVKGKEQFSYNFQEEKRNYVIPFSTLWFPKISFKFTNNFSFNTFGKFHQDFEPVVHRTDLFII